MENKVTVLTLSTALSQATGKGKKACEDFIREFFKVAAETLETGESLRVKGFGTFKIVEVEGRQSVNVNTGEPQEIAPYRKVVFSPAKELATQINAPFEEFESLEMDDDIPEDIFDLEEEVDELEDIQETEEEVKEEVKEMSDENTVNAGIIEAGSDEEKEDDDITYEAYTDIEEKETKNVSEALAHASPIISEDFNSEIPIYEEEEPVKSRFGIGFLTGSLSTFAVCAVIFMLGCFLGWWPVNFYSQKEIKNTVESLEATESAKPGEEPQETELQEIPEPVYDTVSTTRYLTTIAREHYGNYNFWPYIYIENQSILGHPDRITPGTKVVVPELSKYGVDVNNKDDVKKAKELSQEIYSRYR